MYFEFRTLKIEDSEKSFPQIFKLQCPELKISPKFHLNSLKGNIEDLKKAFLRIFNLQRPEFKIHSEIPFRFSKGQH